MRYTITIETQRGDKLTRNMEWDIDSDFTGKGEVIEDMMETLETSYEAWTTAEDQHN